ncbi:nuclear transport factor 2 family protein [Arthrobacter sp. AQ5-06]|nr:nuclear transport factor 2 family protein [Arthrobacter sp. AQ5-06]
MDTPDGVDRIPEGAVRRMFTAARQHNIDAMVAEFTDDYVNITPIHPGRSFTGSAQVRSNWSGLFAGIPDLTLEVLDAASAAGGKVWVEWASRGTRRDGVPVEQAGVAIFTVSGDRLSAIRFYLEPVEHESGDVDAAIRAVAGLDSQGSQP